MQISNTGDTDAQNFNYVPKFHQMGIFSTTLGIFGQKKSKKKIFQQGKI